MNNYLILTGILVEKPLLQTISEKQRTIICLEIRRYLEKKKDYIKCELNGTVAEKICEYCDKGDLISVKARIENLDNETFDYKIIGEQVLFMQCQSK